MKKIYLWAFIATVAVAMSSCNMFNRNQPTFQLSDLQGLWQENSKEHFVRFTTEQSDEAGYFLGYEWDNADWDDPEMTFEEYLLWNREQLGHPVNGWFKYNFNASGELTEIIFMEYDWAEIPKVYVVSKLTETDLEYYEKGYENFVFHFSKVVEPQSTD